MRPKSFNRFMQLIQIVTPPFPQLLIPNPNLNSHSLLLTNPPNMLKEFTTSPENKNSTLQNTIRALVATGMIMLPAKSDAAQKRVQANNIGAPGCNVPDVGVSKWKIEDQTGGSIEKYFPNDLKTGKDYNDNDAPRYLFWKDTNKNGYPFDELALGTTTLRDAHGNAYNAVDEILYIDLKSGEIKKSLFEHIEGANLKNRSFEWFRANPSGIAIQDFECEEAVKPPPSGGDGGGGGCFMDTIQNDSVSVAGEIIFEEAKDLVKKVKAGIAGLFQGKESAPAR